MLVSLCSGVELLLDEVYDTAFSGLEPGLSFSQTNMYRILQRRFLAIQLAMSGRFKCTLVSSIWHCFYQWWLVAPSFVGQAHSE